MGHNRTRGWKTITLSLFLLFFLPGCSTGPGLQDQDQPVHHLVVLHTNDHHGHPLKFPHAGSQDAGGLPARASLVRQVREENPHVLLLDAGDLNTGRSESNLFKARPDIEGYNYLRYDAVALGNHEFDHPQDVLKQQMASARFPFLCANLQTKGGVLFTQPYIIREFGGFKVAVFGLTLKETVALANPSHVQDLLFMDEIQTARALVPRLREEADLVIGLTHLGLFESYTGSRRLASEVSGIDVIVDGHSHTRLDSPIQVRNPSGSTTLVVQAWKWGLVLGRLDLWIQGGRVIGSRYKAVPINLREIQRTREGTIVHGPPEIPEDPVLLKLLQPYAEEAESRLSEVIGSAADRFSSSRARSEETAVGNLVADSMQWYAAKWGADFAVQNGGSIRSDLPAGPVSLKSIYDMLPFDNSIVLLSLRGEDVSRLFDFMAAVPPGSGGFPQFSREVSAVLDRTSRRFTGVLVNGRPIDPEKTYRIATNSYLAAGGDGYRIFLEGREKWDTAATQQPVLIEYIKAMGGRLTPETGGRITIRP
jgi:5'-nucleotidase/UDP-sugar diphosphatase